MNKKESKNKINLDKDYIVAFVLCAITMFIFAICSVKQYGSDASLVMGDAHDLYLPGAKAMARNIWNGQGLTYAWDLSMGMNAVVYYTAVVGGSIVNLLYVFFPFMTAETFILLSLVIKGGFCGVAFVWFSKRYLKVDSFSSILFSVFYAVCGYQVCINSVNFIWMDMLYMLPIILGLIVALIEEGKFLLLIIAYAYLFICNFYIAYIVGFFSAMFFLGYLVLHVKSIKRIIVIGCKYALSVMTGAGLMAFALLPSAKFLVEKYHSGINLTETPIIGKDILVQLSRLLWGTVWTDQIYYPYIYCGVVALILIPLYFCDKKIDLKDKILLGSLLGIMLLSCVVYPLYIFWHGFDDPDMWYYRFAFIISFLCVSISCKAFANRKDYGVKKIIMIAIVACVLTFVLGIRGYLKIDQPKIGYVGINVLILIIWTVIILLWRKDSKGKNITLIVLAMVEVISNGCIGHNIYQSGLEYGIVEDEMDDAMNILRADTSFYRINNDNRIMINSDTNWGYKGVADFCSFENQELRSTLSALGGYTSSRVVKGHGFNDFTQMILGIKYNIILSGGYHRGEMGAQVYQYPRCLSLGFMVDSQIKDLSLADNVFENNNSLATAMMGEETTLFYSIPEDQITIEENGINLIEDQIFYLLRDSDSEETNSIIYSVPYNGDSAYVAFGSSNRGIISNALQIWEPDSGRDNGLLTVRYTKQMDYDGEKMICSIMMKEGVTADEGNYDKVEFRYLDGGVLEKVYDKLSNNQLEIESYKNGYVKGKVRVENKEQVLFTSIPYDTGWHIKSVQGELSVIPLIDEAFLGIIFPQAGEYEIELSYEVPGLRTGMIISILCLILMILMYTYKIGSEKNEERKIKEKN